MKKIVFLITLVFLTFSQTAHSEENFNIWCKDKLTKLQKAKSQALMFYLNNDIQGSINLLEEGLKTAAEDTDKLQSLPLTIKAIKRGADITTSVKLATSSDTNHLRALNYFLNEYYEFIIEVANNLDIPFFENTRCGYCRATTDKFERLFVRFAFKQVQMILDSFAINHAGMVYPKGSVKTFTTGLKMTSLNASTDLKESILAQFYSCKIMALEELATDLETNRYPNEVLAFRNFYAQAAEVVNNSWRCPSDIPTRHDNGNDDYTTTVSLLSRPIILEAGTTRSISIPNPSYVKKLIITAEGVRNDAKFEVMVNGDVKGSIYVPGRDPSYIVTIEDYASSIELISQFGKARINQIMVVRQ